MNTDLSPVRSAWNAALERELPAAQRLRRELHHRPRVSGEEQETTAAVTAAMGIESVPVAETGAIARIGPDSGPAIAIRGELDALPVTEESGLDWASTNGAMHACGHDVHLAALTALVRAARDVELPLGLVPMLQPREETYPSGALDISRSGWLQELRVAYAIGAHVHPGVAVGTVATGSGLVNAAAGEIEFVVRGKSGHGAYPHQAQDVAVAVAQVVAGIPETVRRTTDPMQPALVSVGTIRVGDGAANVLPGTGRILATVRAPHAREAARLAGALRDFATSIAAAFGCTAEVEYTQGEPSLINDARLVAHTDRALHHVGLETAEPMRSLGADDFSYFGEAVPSVMCFVGVDAAAGASLHDARFVPDDGAVARVARTMMAGYLGAAGLLQEESTVAPTTAEVGGGTS